jgi:RNA polymerase primary sigma factor
MAETGTPKRRRRREGGLEGFSSNLEERSALDQYLREVSRHELLTPAEEIELGYRALRGDEEAVGRMVRANLRFVISVAKKYQNRGVSLIDLIQEGNVGLVTAARKFDPDQGREPTIPEIAEAAHLTPEVVTSLQTLNAAEIRLDAPIGDSDDSQLVERFMWDEAHEPEEAVEERLLAEHIERALETLSPRDARVVRLYFGLEGGREHTLEEIGNMLGVTRERVRQLRDRALRRLREGDLGPALESFAA